MKPVALLSLAVAALAAAPARADLILPGHRAVVHELVLQDDPAARAWSWIAAPWPGLAGVHAVRPGEPFRFSAKYGTRLYALAPGETPPEHAEPAALAGLRGLDIPVVQVAQVPSMNPLGRVRTLLRVRAGEDGALSLEVVGEQRWDAAGRPLSGPGMLPWLLATAACGAVALVLVARRAARELGVGLP